MLVVICPFPLCPAVRVVKTFNVSPPLVLIVPVSTILIPPFAVDFKAVAEGCGL